MRGGCRSVLVEADDEVVVHDPERPRPKLRRADSEGAPRDRLDARLEDLAEGDLLERRAERLLVGLDPVRPHPPRVLERLERETSQRVHVRDEGNRRGLDRQCTEERALAPRGGLPQPDLHVPQGDENRGAILASLRAAAGRPASLLGGHLAQLHLRSRMQRDGHVELLRPAAAAQPRDQRIDRAAPKDPPEIAGRADRRGPRTAEGSLEQPAEERLRQGDERGPGEIARPAGQRRPAFRRPIHRGRERQKERSPPGLHTRRVENELLGPAAKSQAPSEETSGSVDLLRRPARGGEQVGLEPPEAPLDLDLPHPPQEPPGEDRVPARRGFHEAEAILRIGHPRARRNDLKGAVPHGEPQQEAEVQRAARLHLDPGILAGHQAPADPPLETADAHAGLPYLERERCGAPFAENEPRLGQLGPVSEVVDAAGKRRLPPLQDRPSLFVEHAAQDPIEVALRDVDEDRVARRPRDGRGRGETREEHDRPGPAPARAPRDPATVEGRRGGRRRRWPSHARPEVRVSSENVRAARCARGPFFERSRERKHRRIVAVGPFVVLDAPRGGRLCTNSPSRTEPSPQR